MSLDYTLEMLQRSLSHHIYFPTRTKGPQGGPEQSPHSCPSGPRDARHLAHIPLGSLRETEAEGQRDLALEGEELSWVRLAGSTYTRLLSPTSREGSPPAYQRMAAFRPPSCLSANTGFKEPAHSLDKPAGIFPAPSHLHQQDTQRHHGRCGPGAAWPGTGGTAAHQPCTPVTWESAGLGDQQGGLSHGISPTTRKRGPQAASASKCAQGCRPRRPSQPRATSRHVPTPSRPAPACTGGGGRVGAGQPPTFREAVQAQKAGQAPHMLWMQPRQPP